MDTKQDILNRADIERFIMDFYEKVKTDETIGIVFTEIIPLDWDQHIPLIVDFWETILLDHPVYKKNAMEVHYKINKIFPLQKKHFDAWLHLFNTTLDGMFEGTVTMLAKKRAADIGRMMLYKMDSQNNIL